MSTLNSLTILCMASALAVLMPYSIARSQTVDDPAVYALANQLADELELVRERMGRPYDDSPRLPVSEITEIELYFQAQLVLRKSNQLAQELAGAAPHVLGPVPSGDVRPADVYGLLEDSLEQIRHVADSIGITEQTDFDRRLARIAPTGVFLVVIDINRQLNLMLRVPISDSDVFDEISAAVTYAASLLSRYPGAVRVPDAPPFEGYRRPSDVYRRLLDCIDIMSRVAPKAGVPVLSLSSRRNIPDDIDPGHVLDIARLLTADLAALVNALDAPVVRQELPTPRHIFSTAVYAQAGILQEQLEELDRQL